MTIPSFNQEINSHWASHFHCPVAMVQQAGTTLLPEDKYAGDKVLALWHIGAHTFVQYDPAYTQALEQVVKALPPDTSLRGDDVQRMWGEAAIKSRDIGLVHYLYPPDLPPYQPSPPFVLRPLTLADAGLMQVLHQANTPEDVDEGYVEVDHEVVFGCLVEGELVAAASGYQRTGFIDIGVLTHPGYRRHGLGKAVVGALCSWSIEHGFIPQYRCNQQNTASHGVAKSLCFRYYFQSESIWLT